jgi:hypothetical protein
MLAKLSPVPGSSYKEAEVDPDGVSRFREECMPGIRMSILAELMAWATASDGPEIYLLTGMAGTGKSTIACSFAKLLDGMGLLGASFFCSHKHSVQRNALGIIPTIAFQLAHYSPIFTRGVINSTTHLYLDRQPPDH